MAEDKDFPKSIGDVAKAIGVPVHRVEYLVTSREIKPVDRTGRMRLFDVDEVRAAHEAALDGQTSAA